MFERLIAFSFFRFGDKPCVYLYNISTGCEVLKISSALSAVAFVFGKFILQTSMVLGKEPIEDKEKLKDMVSAISRR